MANTQNLNLKKPEALDNYNVEDQNGNMDILDQVVSNKVDKVENKDLSSNDYTDEEKAKLTNIEENANNYVHPSSHSADIITESSTRKMMTADERSKLAGIESGATNYQHPSTHPAGMITQDSTHRFVSDAEKNKLAGIENGATNYQHPASHSAGMITQDSNHRFVTDSEKSTWNNKASSSHNHDSRYYTESEINTKLNGKSNTNHNHSGVYEPANGNIVKKNVSTTLTARFTAQNNTAYTTKQIRNITLSTADPSGGSNGDVWIKYDV